MKKSLKNLLKHYKFPKLFTIAVLILIVYSIFVRAQGLGYSGFQGDEVNPMDFLYEMKNGVLPYLLAQKRGPVQYIINMFNIGIFGYHSEWQVRFPFLLFGIGALFTIYKLTEKIFDDKNPALIAALLMAVNGLFIAFARITQYQSFMYFLIPIGVFVFINALKEKSSKLFLYSGLIMSLALLAHYDTLSVVPFFVVGFAGVFYREVSLEHSSHWRKLLVEYIKKTGIFFSAMLIPALAYYVPFYLNQSFESTTSGYLENRLLGGGFMPRTAITTKLLAMYIPEWFIYVMFVLGIVALLSKTSKITLHVVSQHVTLIKSFYVFMIFLVLSASLFSFYPIKPRTSSLLVIGASIAISGILTLSRKVDWKFAALATWFLGVYSFYFFIMKDPRTHIYVAFIPLFILAGYGFYSLYKKLTGSRRTFLLAALIVSIVWLSGVNWVIFVDKSPEYPWWDKDFLGWPIYRIERVRHKKIEGVFGFNNYRAWDRVRDLYDRGCLTGSFNSNEKDSITYFYVRQHQKQGGEWGLQTDADNLIIVEGPHSWEYFSTDQNDYSGFTLLKVLYSNGIPVSYIFGDNDLYPEGKFLCEL